jgi:hypothetical protein
VRPDIRNRRAVGARSPPSLPQRRNVDSKIPSPAGLTALAAKRMFQWEKSKDRSAIFGKKASINRCTSR